MLTLFGQIAQLLSAESSLGPKIDALGAKVDALAADVAALKTATAPNPDSVALDTIRQMVSDTQTAVINIQAAIGTGGN